MADDMRSILDQVAAGSLTPEQAAQLLGEQQPTPVERLLVKGSAVRLTIVADESVPEAVAEGPHRVERDGSTLRIISDLSDDKAAPQAPRSTFMRWLDAGGRAGSTLAVRVNPFLPLDVLAVAGSLELSGVRAAVSVGLEAGSAKIGPGSGPLQLSVSSGSAEVDWLFVGESRIEVELGSARVNVLAGSDVTVSAASSAGSASVIAADGHDATAGGATAGAGSGTLTARAQLGTVAVRLPGAAAQ
ncbi:MAG: hypothetical protein E6Q90_12355 [Actinobacteria bacterium]|nr:MAG: hypothetical protein E6Q90_12355 [Actinomycetota bacterium]